MPASRSIPLHQGQQLRLGLQVLEQALGVEHAGAGDAFVGLVQRQLVPATLQRHDPVGHRNERQLAVGLGRGPLGVGQIAADHQGHERYQQALALAPHGTPETRAQGPLGLEEAIAQARSVGADYVLYTRFARTDDRIGNGDEWYDEQAVDRLGWDTGVVQMMLIETNTRYLIDTARIKSRGGLLTFHDNTPEDLLGAPMREYARSLLGMSE